MRSSARLPVQRHGGRSRSSSPRSNWTRPPPDIDQTHLVVDESRLKAGLGCAPAVTLVVSEAFGESSSVCAILYPVRSYTMMLRLLMDSQYDRVHFLDCNETRLMALDWDDCSLEVSR